MYVVNWQAVCPFAWNFLLESLGDDECRPNEILKFIQNVCMSENVCHVSHAQYAAWMREFQDRLFE
jgi:hypothetical protein